MSDSSMLVIVLTSKTLRTLLIESLQKYHLEIFFKFWMEMHYLSKQYFSTFVLKERIKELKQNFFQNSSQIQLSGEQKKWEMIWESSEKNLLDTHNPILKNFVEGAKNIAELNISEKLKEFMSTYLPDNKSDVEYFDGVVSLIASGERDYLFDISQYEKHFFNGLQSKSKKSGWISSSQVELFGSLENFIAFHKNFLMKIQKMQMLPISSRNIGEIFLSHSQGNFILFFLLFYFLFNFIFLFLFLYFYF